MQTVSSQQHALLLQHLFPPPIKPKLHKFPSVPELPPANQQHWDFSMKATGKNAKPNKHRPQMTNGAGGGQGGSGRGHGAGPGLSTSPMKGLALLCSRACHDQSDWDGHSTSWPVSSDVPALLVAETTFVKKPAKLIESKGGNMDLQGSQCPSQTTISKESEKTNVKWLPPFDAWNWSPTVQGISRSSKQ